jgi:hypothetical protein
MTGSSLRSPISNAIIKLNEIGRIPELKEKWWKKERGGGSCTVSKINRICGRNTEIHFWGIFFALQEEESTGGVAALNIVNVGGIFLVLLIGLVLGGILAGFEKLWTICAKKRKFT